MAKYRWVRILHKCRHMGRRGDDHRDEWTRPKLTWAGHTSRTRRNRRTLSGNFTEEKELVVDRREDRERNWKSTYWPRVAQDLQTVCFIRRGARQIFYPIFTRGGVYTWHRHVTRICKTIAIRTAASKNSLICLIRTSVTSLLYE